MYVKYWNFDENFFFFQIFHWKFLILTKDKFSRWTASLNRIRI